MQRWTKHNSAFPCDFGQQCTYTSGLIRAFLIGLQCIRYTSIIRYGVLGCIGVGDLGVFEVFHWPELSELQEYSLLLAFEAEGETAIPDLYFRYDIVTCTVIVSIAWETQELHPQ